MIDWSKYERIGEFKDGKLTWFALNKENVVYTIRFTDEFFYIGSTKNLRKRFCQYIHALKHNKYDSLALSDAYLEYGAFDIYILEETNVDNLRQREAYYINSLSPVLNSQGIRSHCRREMGMQKYIRELLKANGMNVKSLIEKSNVTEATIHHFFCGENITLNNLNKIAETFGMKVWFVKK